MCENASANLSVHAGFADGGFSGSRCDRFQGALLGLWLAPTAAALLRSSGAVSHHSLARQDPSDNGLAAARPVSIPLGFNLLRTFALSPNAFHRPLSSLLDEQVLDEPCDKHHLPCWLASAPALLRYHDSRPRRLQWLDLQRASLEALADLNERPLSVAIEQIVMLGDLLEMALGGRTDHLVDYLVELQYLQLFDGGPQASSQEGLTSESLGTLGYPQCYSRLMPRVAFSDETALVAGLVAGAVQGLGGLPVFWQLSSSADSVQASGLARSTVVDIARCLFEQWAGMASIK